MTLPGGATQFEFGAYLGGYADQNDTAAATATFPDSAGRSVGTASLGPVTATDRAT